MTPTRQFAAYNRSGGVRFNFGASLGLGSSHHDYPDEYFRAKGIFAYNAGLFMQLHFGWRMTLQPELLFMSDGSRSMEDNFRLQSVCVPVNLQLNLVKQFGSQGRFYPLAGGYYKYSFSGKAGDETIDFDEEVNPGEWGITFGLGFDLMDWQARMTWMQGLTDISRSDELDLRSAGWFISVGYKF